MLQLIFRISFSNFNIINSIWKCKFQEEHYYSSGVDNLDRDLSSVSNSSASSGPVQEGPERGL